MEERVIYTPKEEIEKRIDGLKTLMDKEGLEIAFFHYKVDYYYLSGTMQDAILLVPLDDEPCLFVRREIERAKKESPFKNIIHLNSQKDMIDYLTPVKKVGIQIDVLPYRDVVRLKELLGNPDIYDASSLVKELRKRKSKFEIMLLERASEIQKRVYEYVPGVLREGMTEIELGGILEAYAKTLGHEGILRMRSLNYEPYSWHILSGESGSIVGYADSPMAGFGLSPAFPVGASFKKIRRGEPVLIDFGVCYHGYQVDQTRIFAIGSIPKKFREAYEVTREIQERIIELLPRGLKSKELFEEGRRIAEKYGYSEYYLGYGPYKVKFLGHGVGLELSELPFIAEGHDYPIEEGATLAIEPKMVFKGEGACGIENTFVFEDGKVRALTDNDESIIII